MARVTGIGGVFFRSRDPAALGRWYADQLGLAWDAEGFARFDFVPQPDPHRQAYALWAPFSDDTGYFGESGQAFMINFRVDDLDRLLTRLRARGVPVESDIETTAQGRFAWITDPEGNRVELWEPGVVPQPETQ